MNFLSNASDIRKSCKSCKNCKSFSQRQTELRTSKVVVYNVQSICTVTVTLSVGGWTKGKDLFSLSLHVKLLVFLKDIVMFDKK